VPGTPGLLSGTRGFVPGTPGLLSGTRGFVPGTPGLVSGGTFGLLPSGLAGRGCGSFAVKVSWHCL